MVMQKKAWMITYPFKEWLIFFNKSMQRGISQENHHILILDGYGSHVTIEVVKPWNLAIIIKEKGC